MGRLCLDIAIMPFLNPGMSQLNEHQLIFILSRVISMVVDIHISNILFIDVYKILFFISYG